MKGKRTSRNDSIMNHVKQKHYNIRIRNNEVVKSVLKTFFQTFFVCIAYLTSIHSSFISHHPTHHHIPPKITSWWQHFCY